MLALSLWPRLMKTSTLQLKRCFKLFYLSVLLEKVLILWTHHNILKKKSHRWACIFVSIAMHYSVKIKYLLKRSCSTTVLFFKLLTPYFMEIVFSFFFFLKINLFFICECHSYYTKFEQASDVMLIVLKLEEEVLDLLSISFLIKSLPGARYMFFFSWCKTEIYKWLSLITRWFSNLNVNLSDYRKVVISWGLLFLGVFSCRLENNTEELLAPASDSCWGQGIAKQGWAMKVWQRSQWTVVQPL